eukprot:scaffold204529_cov37-Attheya_sp.AAC.1
MEDDPPSTAAAAAVSRDSMASWCNSYMEMGRRNTLDKTASSGPPPYNPPSSPRLVKRNRYSSGVIRPSAMEADRSKSDAGTML